MRRATFPLLITAVAALTCAVLAAAAAPPTATAFVPGRAFGIGEQQVYTIEQSAKLTVRFRRPDGTLVSKDLISNAKRSVAFTVEGVSSAGAPVLAVTTATMAPAAGASPTPGRIVRLSTVPAAVPSPSAPPSPEVGADGSVRVDGDLADLAPLGGVLAGASPDRLEPNTKWRSDAVVRLQLATLGLHLTSTANAPANPDEEAGVVSVTSAGSADVSGNPKIAGYGATTLRGSGAVTIQAFVDQQRGVVLGLVLIAGSRGNATSARGDRGQYELNVQSTVHLARYVSGVPIPSSPAPGAQPTLNTLSRPASPSSVYSNTVGNPLAHPEPTDVIFRATPAPETTEAATPVPSESLAPVPIPVSSDAPIASPPPPPTASPGP